MPRPWQRVCCHASLPALMGEIATRLSKRTPFCFLSCVSLRVYVCGVCPDPTSQTTGAP